MNIILIFNFLFSLCLPTTQTMGVTLCRIFVVAFASNFNLILIFFSYFVHLFSFWLLIHVFHCMVGSVVVRIIRIATAKRFCHFPYCCSGKANLLARKIFSLRRPAGIYLIGFFQEHFYHICFQGRTPLHICSWKIFDRKCKAMCR